MENWLHSGIDKNILANEYENFKKIGFPLKPIDDELYDLYSELVELDGHIAGLVSSYLNNKKIDYKLLDADEEFNRILSNIQESQYCADIVEYKRHLDKLIQMIKLIEGISA